MQIINRKIPQEGEPSTLMERLNDYIKPVDKEWFSRVKPSDMDSINKLRKLIGLERVGLNFPETFIEFAKYAGEGDGGLLTETLLGKFSISTMIEEIKESIIDEKVFDMWQKEIYIKKKDLFIPEEEMFSCDIDISSPFYFDFFINEIGIFYSIALQDNVEKGVYQDEHFLCDSFEKFLFQNAIQLYEYGYFNISVSFDLTFDYPDEKSIIKQYPRQFEILDKLSIKYDLKKAWFSDYNFYFTYSDEISIYVNNSYSTLGIIRGNNEKLVEKIANDLLPEVNARHINKD